MNNYWAWESQFKISRSRSKLIIFFNNQCRIIGWHLSTPDYIVRNNFFASVRCNDNHTSLAVFLGLVFTNCVLIWRKFTCWMIFTSKCQTTWVIVWLMWKKIVTRFSYMLIIIPSFGLFPRNAWHYDPSCADSAFLEAWIYNKQVVYLYISIWLELERRHLGLERRHTGRDLYD